MLDHRLTTGALKMASIRKRGNSWQARVKRLGTEVEQSFKSRQAAERWARQIEVKIELGEYNSPTPNSNAATLNFGEILQRYNDTVGSSHRSPTTQTNIRTLIKDLGHLTLEQVEPKSVAKWRDDKLSKIKSASVNRLIGTLGSVINHARKEWQLPINNPIPNIKRPQSALARSRRLNDDEEQKLINGLPPHYARVVRFAIATGMRRGEILNLEWPCIDIQKRTAHLLITKNGHGRTVPLSTGALLALADAAGSTTYPTSGRVFDIHPVALDKAWRRACAKQGIVGLRFHDLRREAISRFLELGLSLTEASSISGHRTLSQLQVYVKHDAYKLISRIG